MISPQSKINQDLLDMRVEGRKTTSDFTIHKWKMSANAIDDIVERNRVLGIISSYENDYNRAWKYFEESLRLMDGNAINTLIDYSKCLTTAGKMEEALDKLIKALDLQWIPYLIAPIKELSKSMLDNKPLEYLVKRLEERDEHLQINQIFELMEDINLVTSRVISCQVDLKIYRLLMNLIHRIHAEKYFGHFTIETIYSKNLNLIIYPENLQLKEVEELNDDLIDALVDLSDQYDPLELIKMTMYFSTKKNNKEVA